MGRAWGIAKLAFAADVEHWQPVFAAAPIDELWLPIYETTDIVRLARDGSGAVTTTTHGDRGDLLAQIKALRTGDMTWDDVEDLGNAMLFLPFSGEQVIELPSWFGKRQRAHGMDALVYRRGGDDLTCELRAAGNLAIEHHLAIRIVP